MHINWPWKHHPVAAPPAPPYDVLADATDTIARAEWQAGIDSGLTNMSFEAWVISARNAENLRLVLLSIPTDSQNSFTRLGFFVSRQSFPTPDEA